MTRPPALQIWNFLMKNRKSLNSGLMCALRHYLHVYSQEQLHVMFPAHVGCQKFQIHLVLIIFKLESQGAATIFTGLDYWTELISKYWTTI